MSPIGAPHVVSPIEPATPRPIPGADQRSLIQAVKSVNEAQSFGVNRELTFAIDRKTRRVVIRLVNPETGEILDQIPEEYVRRLAEKVK